MKDRLLALGAIGVVGLVATIIVLGSNPLTWTLASAKPPRSDFALFTTQTDDFVTCSATKRAHLHVLATNTGSSSDTINIVFPDGDSVVIRVPAGTSFSFTQVIGTTSGFDDVIKIDPLGAVGELNPMVGWASIDRTGGGSVSCITT